MGTQETLNGLIQRNKISGIPGAFLTDRDEIKEPSKVANDEKLFQNLEKTLASPADVWEDLKEDCQGPEQIRAWRCHEILAIYLHIRKKLKRENKAKPKKTAASSAARKNIPSENAPNDTRTAVERLAEDMIIIRKLGAREEGLKILEGLEVLIRNCKVDYGKGPWYAALYETAYSNQYGSNEGSDNREVERIKQKRQAVLGRLFQNIQDLPEDQREQLYHQIKATSFNCRSRFCTDGFETGEQQEESQPHDNIQKFVRQHKVIIGGAALAVVFLTVIFSFLIHWMTSDSGLANGKEETTVEPESQGDPWLDQEEESTWNQEEENTWNQEEENTRNQEEENTRNQEEEGTWNQEEESVWNQEEEYEAEDPENDQVLEEQNKEVKEPIVETKDKDKAKNKKRNNSDRTN